MTDHASHIKLTIRRHNRRRAHIRKKVFGMGDRPRLVIYRSNVHIYAQLVNDEQGQTITGCSTLTPAVKEKLKKGMKRTEQAKLVGEYIAKLAKEKGITQVSFDRNGRLYHGRVKMLAEAARGAGLSF